MTEMLSVAGKEIVVAGRLVKTARLRAEHYELVEAPNEFIAELEKGKIGADLFTFLQEAADTTPCFDYHVECESISVLPITNYENWWKHQIKDKTRNMIRKAVKKGIDIRIVPFDDALVRGITDIYDESPVRQGKKFWHYGKDFDTIKRDHITFLDRSDFVGAFYEGELVGFIKLVYGRNIARLMQIISKMSYRDKAPTNALIAKAVEICAEKKIPNLHYGIWGRGGLRDFKIHHGFRRVDVPRYFVPLTWKGVLLLKSRLYPPCDNYVPDAVIETMYSIRAKWYTFRYRESLGTTR